MLTKTFYSKYSWENLFYALSLFIVLMKWEMVSDFSKNMERADWVFPWNVVSISSSSTYLLWVYLVFAGFLVLSLIPLRFAPILSLLLWTAWLGLENSFGKINHVHHSYFLISLGLSLALVIDKKKSMDYALAAGFYIYTVSGIWKLVELFKEPDFFSALTQNLPHHIAYGLAENHRVWGEYFLNFFSQQASASASLWMLVILTELFVPLLLIFCERWRAPLLVVLILFHEGSGWIVGPQFSAQIYLLSLLVVVNLFKRFGK